MLLAALAGAHRSLGALLRSQENTSSGNWFKREKNKTLTQINKQKSTERNRQRRRKHESRELSASRRCQSLPSNLEVGASQESDQKRLIQVTEYIRSPH
ncbi:hypothetical protein BDP55DRAFT_666971 [Colletotrichum godetiae]|uniref:Uncharacterized protein n=1 Tax=Colletotrichum godetiae TaxID=1209918 RepID=A0AAJ0AIM7_9PEZI|nr:uncharacterized protein BDP55DRAFT_666971 [Colletotrichum godetiae]KAK1674599.1 hypothetical protein BDP55DRAFT_666971 [Colletotrichum godetiae]